MQLLRYLDEMTYKCNLDYDFSDGDDRAEYYNDIKL